MKKLQIIAKHLVSTQIPESEKAMHVSHRIIKIAEQTLDQDEFQRFRHKYIDYTSVSFPEVNPFELVSSDKRFRLANYRYPSVAKERKGIIYFIHGYGEYVRRYAYFGEIFAEHGYDFVGIDQRGFGYSEGERGMIEREQLTIEDLI
jgi:pimeloyl-ACP methyl ester carboxylesterase